jgi:hypothetical protein
MRVRAGRMGYWPRANAITSKLNNRPPVIYNKNNGYWYLITVLTPNKRKLSFFRLK